MREEETEAMGMSGKPITILMADDDPDDRQLTKEAFEESLLANDLRFVEDGIELLDYLKRRGKYADPATSPRPGLILLDLNMPKKDGREALTEIKADRNLRTIRVVILTTSKAEEDILRSYDLSASSYITKPVTFESLLDVVKTLGKYWLEIVELPARTTEGKMDQRLVRVLLVDDDEDDFFLTREFLNDIPQGGFELSWEPNYQAALKALRSNAHDVCLLDYRLGEHTGLDLLRAVRAEGSSIPVILLTGMGERSVDVAAMEAGAAGFLEKTRLDGATLDRVIRYALLEKRHADELERKVRERTIELTQANAALQAEVLERKRVESALRESEARFHHLADSMPQIVWVINVDDTLEFINRRWTEYTGLTLDQTRNRADVKTAIHPDDVPLINARVQESKAARAPYEVEFRLRQASTGLYRWFLGRGIPVLDEEGRILRWYGTSTDIDDHKRTAEFLRESDRRKDQFLATLAHELRNPLPPIRNALEIMRLTNNDTQAVERGRAMIERQVKQLIRLIDDLLDISRITRGKVRLRVEQIELGAVVQNAVETCQPILDAAGHQLTLRLPGAPLMLRADPTRLAQILVNLLNNAAKYTDRGGHITLSVEQLDRQVIIRVADTGIGIAREMLSSIFEMFNQVGRTEDRSQSGLGIGLSIVRGLVTLHNGTVEAKSAGLEKEAN